MSIFNNQLSIINNQNKDIKLSSLVYSTSYPDNQVLLLVYSLSWNPAQVLVRIIIIGTTIWKSFTYWMWVHLISIFIINDLPRWIQSKKMCMASKRQADLAKQVLYSFRRRDLWNMLEKTKLHHFTNLNV